MQIDISDVKYERKIYPIQKPNTSVIESYADALFAREELPPIVLEEGTNILLDGYHRWKAHQRLVTQPELFDNGDHTLFQHILCEYLFFPDGIPPKLYAASLSSRHGLHISAADCKDMAREFFRDYQALTQATIADYVGRSQRTISEYVKNLKAERDENEQAIILRLERLGWTQQEIAEATGKKQSTISEIVSEIAHMLKPIQSRLTSGILPETVARDNRLYLPLTWALNLDGCDDAERMKELSIGILPYDVWTFPECHDLYSREHPGRTAGQLIANTLYFLYQTGGVVLDPMCVGRVLPKMCAW